VRLVNGQDIEALVIEGLAHVDPEGARQRV
jgi:hypothetical protein